MKKMFFISILCCLLIVSGCGTNDVPIATDTPEPTQESTLPTTSTSPSEQVSEFYKKMQSDTRPIAVMIDNDDNNARPQIGLESAYLVYEIVVEGGATRYMALFKEHDLEKIGPVRSSRHYFLDYVMENDAIYAHCGWSPKASHDISSLGINNINGINGYDGKNFWRDNTYNRTWHNLYTSLVKLHDYAENSKKYRITTDQKLLEYNTTDITPEAGSDISKISIPYTSAYNVTFTYDPDNGVFVKKINGNEYKSQTGDLISAKNIIVYTVANHNLNDGEGKGRQDLSNIGNGTGYYISDGKAVKINWEKTSRNEKTRYTYEDGTEIVLNPGNTFIQIVPSARGFTIE